MVREITDEVTEAKDEDVSRPVELIEMYLDTGTFYFALYDVNVVFDSHTYIAVSGKRTSLKSSDDTSIADITFQLDGIDDIVDGGPTPTGQTFTEMLFSTDFNGRRCVLKKVFADRLANPNDCIIMFDGDMDSPRLEEGVFQFDVLSPISSLNISAGRKMTSNCPWDFQGSECGFAESAPTLEKRIFRTTDIDPKKINDTVNNDKSDDYFNNFRIAILGTFTYQGVDAGEVRAVTDYTNSTGKFEFDTERLLDGGYDNLQYLLINGKDVARGGVVSEAGYTSTNLIIYDPNRIEPTRWWNAGILEFTSGDNNGVKRIIKQSTVAPIFDWGHITAKTSETIFFDTDYGHGGVPAGDVYIVIVEQGDSNLYYARKLTNYNAGTKEYTIASAFPSTISIGDAFVVAWGLNSDISLGGSLEFFKPLPYTPSVGDRYTITQGCEKTWEMCYKTHAYIERFGGFIGIPKNRDDSGKAKND